MSLSHNRITGMPGAPASTDVTREMTAAERQATIVAAGQAEKLKLKDGTELKFGPGIE